MNSEVSLNGSFMSEPFPSFPATPIAEDFFKNLPKPTTPGLSDTDTESTTGACISNIVDDTCSSFVCTNPSFNYSNMTQALTKSTVGNSYLGNSDFQTGYDKGLLVPSSLNNNQISGSSVLRESSNVSNETKSCLKSANSSSIKMKSTSDKSFFTIHIGNNCEVFSDMPVNSSPTSCSSAFHVSNSSDIQPDLTLSSLQHASEENSIKRKGLEFLHKEIATVKRTNTDKCANPNVEKDCEKGVLPPDLCLFEVVSMLKCSHCNGVFPDTASLIQHYQKSHLAGQVASPVQIKVDTAANAILQKNKPVVVCHKCGSKIPSSVLEWYASKVQEKLPGHRKKAQESSELGKSTLTALSDSSNPASEVDHGRSKVVLASPDDVTTHACNWTASLSPTCGSLESCDDASQAACMASGASQEETSSSPGEPSVTTHTAATEGHCSDDSSELSEEESNLEDGGKKEDPGDSTMQVYVLDVLGGTTEHKSQGAGDGSERQKRLVRPPAQLTDDETPSVAFQTPPKIHKCNMEGCRLRFSSPELCDLHRRCHRPAGASGFPFICPFCSYTMKKWYCVQRHLWKVHQQDLDMLRCSVCSTFRAHNEHTLRVHQETHAAVKPYPCQTCDQSFRQLSQLLNHSKTHHRPKEQQPAVQCSECGKLCCNKRQLIRHLKAVHEKVCLHRCALCPYATNRPADLRSHNRRHAKDKSFECCVCEMRFCDRTSQRRHLLRHLPLSLLQCPLCSFHTSRPQHFSSHFSALHPPLQQQQQQHALSFECKVSCLCILSLSQCVVLLTMIVCDIGAVVEGLLSYEC
ncbi:Zinc finger C2H2-type [Trinorchestia longiramus]|nr:Zinc finger C2H2-type [Trinorchestia longiramus]